MFSQSYCYSGLVTFSNQPTNVRDSWSRSGAKLSVKKFSSQPIIANTSCSGAELISHTDIKASTFEIGKSHAYRQSIKTKKGFRSNDNLADLLSRIRNGYFRSFEDILVIDSKQNRELLDALICTGYIYNWRVAPTEGGTSPTKSSILQVNLKYFQNMPAIRGIQQISRPGNRTYINIKRILKYSQEQNWGESKTLFLSTSEGILNHREVISNERGSNILCSKVSLSNKNPGTHSGEALCLIW